MKKSKSVILLLCLIVTIGGCASRQMAQVKSSTKAEQFFLNEQHPDQYRYFYYGTENRPIAFLALEKSYSIESEFWTSIESNEIRLPGKFAGYGRHTRIGEEFRGKEILSPSAETIGLVYSRYYWVTAWFAPEDGNRIIIPPPEPEVTQPEYSRKSRDNP